MTDPLDIWTKAAVDEATGWGRKLETATADRIIEVLSKTVTADGMSGTVETWNTVLLTFQGRIRASGRDPQSLNLGGSENIRQLWEIVAPHGINISIVARLRDQATGTTYAVVADDQPRSESAATHILCYEV